jgi:hypothetical protein
VVLDENDWIDINHVRHHLKIAYTNLNSHLLAEIINTMFEYGASSLSVEVDETNRLQFVFTDTEANYSIIGMSYNMRQITGFYNSEFPIHSQNGVINAPSVGFYLSTPILYLISNIGTRCFIHRSRQAHDNRMVMRINNSFIANFPIVSTNAEFVTIVHSNSLSDVWFQLVDANMIPIKSLSPLFISAFSEGSEVSPQINVVPLETSEPKESVHGNI